MKRPSLLNLKALLTLMPFVVLLVGIPIQLEAQIAAWDTNGLLASPVPTTVAATTVAPNLVVGPLERGAGLSAAGLANAFSSSNFLNTGSAGAISGNKYLQFSVASQSGFSLSLSSLDVVFRRSSTGPNTFQWQYSFDGFSTAGVNIGSSISYVGTESNGLAQTTVDLSVIPALQNIPSSTTISLRLYGWGASATSGTFAIGRLTGNDLAIGGTITSSGGPTCGIAISSVSAICDDNTAGIDTYTLSILYTGSQSGVIVTNASGSGDANSGTDPASGPGTMVFENISEADDYVITFSGDCSVLNAGTSGSAPSCTPPPTTTIVINEVDSDTPGADVAEFIELFGPANEALDGMVVVLFNGADDQSYAAFDLDGYSLDANGFFVLGNSAVPNVDLVIANGTIQNGEDAVALYFGNGTDYPNGTSVTTSNLIDALVYDTSDPDDAGLLVLLNVGQPQVNENENGNSATESNSRVPDGGTQRNTNTYVAQTPTPGATNVPACGVTLGTPLVECVNATTYQLSIPYTGVQAGVTVINNSGSGSVDLVTGDDPATDPNGTILITVISDINAYDVSLSAPCGSQTVSGAAPSCEPPPTLVINEVEYNNPGTDTDEWIELHNYGPDPVQLAGVTIELINGNGGGALLYGTIVLPSVILPAGGYYVVGNNAGNPNVDLLTTETIQNGSPDAIGLRGADNTLLDAVSYEGTSGAPYVEGTGSAAGDSGSDAEEVIARVPNGTDTDDNSADWQRWCATPGASNDGVIDDDVDGVPNCVDPCPLAQGVIDNFDNLTCNCLPGYYQVTIMIGPNEVITGCTICPEGSYCPDGIAAFPCLAGTAQGLQGQSSCAPCDPGSFSGEDGAIACQLCPANTFNPLSGQIACEPCDVGETSAPGSTECTPAGAMVTVALEINTDANDDEITWEIRDANTDAVICSGGPYSNGTPSFQLDLCDLNDPGLYNLIVYDSGNDGILNGGYTLRMAAPDNRRIIDNRDNGDFGDESRITDNPYSFSIPVGDDRLIYTSCDKYWWKTGEYIVANANPAVSAEWVNGPNSAQDSDSGYEFWFYNPNGGYSFRKFRPHNQSDNFAPANEFRACHLKINNWNAAMHIPEGDLMNVKIRGRVNGVNFDWGPACRFVRDEVLAQCPPTKLMDIPGNQFLSCNQTRQFVSNQRVHARPVSGGNQYMWRFKNIDNNSEIERTSGPYFLNLGWSAAQAPPLVEGQYWVWVKARRNIPGLGQTWCMYGDSCLLTITPSFDGGGTNMAIFGEGTTMNMWPNPNRGDQLFLSLDVVPEDVKMVSVDLYDLFGKKVDGRTIPVNEGYFSTVCDLNSDLSNGVYFVTVTAGSERYTKRLVIQK